MSRRPIAKVVAAFVVGLAAVALVAAAGAVGIDLRDEAAGLLVLVLAVGAAYLQPDGRVDQRAGEPNGAAHRERGAD